MDNLPPGCSESDLPGCSKEDADYEEWLAENEDQVMADFIEENYNDAELLYGAIGYATTHDCRGLTAEDLIECYITTNKKWNKKFEEYLIEAWEAARE